MKSLLRALDLIRETVGIAPGWADPLLRPMPLEAVSFAPSGQSEAKALSGETSAALHRIRPEVPVSDFDKQLRNPIASRAIAVWIRMEIPALGKTLTFDSRLDNPLGLPASIAAIPAGSANDPWPEPPEVRVNAEKIVLKGHGGSSCPGMFTKAIENAGQGGVLDIPVEVLAFHCEGAHPEGRYSICMYSEVLGRVTASPGAHAVALNMWGKMLITFEPTRPADYRGHKVIQLVSDDYVRQTGTVSGFPPHGAGEYVESKGSERYVGLNPGQRHLEAFVKQGRIIFSTDIDDFLHARTRVTGFEIVDKDGKVLQFDGPPYIVGDFSAIAGVRLSWPDIRADHPEVSYYLLYRLDPDFPKDFQFLARVTGNVYTDTAYSGRRSFAYAVVPAFRDQTGMEVQGVSLDHAMVMALEPDTGAFDKRNHGVGHVRTV
ncbi:hypothetical protein [Tropicibacter sp. S64]|uniref:hypothetical protein n=1 Tax=Tropicibacter sp. S64 TaxID=3415122 RepID=UPI003C7C8C47